MGWTKTQNRFIQYLMIGSIIMLFVFNARTSETAYASGETNNLAAFLTLPSEIPFRLMLPRNGGAGYVDSREFWITNNGEDVVALALDRVRVHIADGEFFALSYDESFPGDGNYLYLTLICAQNGIEQEYVLTDSPQTTHMYWLEKDESASFRISGAVSEGGDHAWPETTVTVSMTFSFSVESPLANAEMTDETGQDGMDELADAADVQSDGITDETDSALDIDLDSETADEIENDSDTATITELVAERDSDIVAITELIPPENTHGAGT